MKIKITDDNGDEIGIGLEIEDSIIEESASLDINVVNETKEAILRELRKPTKKS